MLENEIDHMESKVTTQNTYLKMINHKIRNIVADQYKDKSAGVQVQLATKVQKVLDEYILKLKEKKLQLLEVYLLEELRRLLHKENLITKVTINKISFEITLYDKDENAIPKDFSVKKYTDFNLNANITLGVEKHRNHIHAIIKGNGFYLNSEAEDPASMYKAIDHCVDKLETQLRRGKFNSHEKKTGKESIRQNVLAQAETLPVMDEETL